MFDFIYFILFNIICMYVFFYSLFSILFLRTGGWYNDLFWWLGDRRVCYDELGCFSTKHPFSNSEGHLPQSPETLNIRILLFTRGQGEAGFDATDNVGQNFDQNKNIKMIIHGYFNNLNETWLNEMKNALLRKVLFFVYFTYLIILKCTFFNATF